MLARFALHDDRTLFLFVFASERDIPVASLDLGAQKRILHEQFGGELWECRHRLAELDRAPDLYFDRVSQITRRKLVKGPSCACRRRPAFCISLTGGQGSALAMIAAYVLAGELTKA